MTADRATRRDALRLAGGALVAAGVLGARPAFAQEEEDDPTILDRLIRVEQRAVVLYEALVARDLLAGPARSSVALLRDQEREHVTALATAVEDLGGSTPAPPPADSIEGLRALRGEDDVLRFAIRLETVAVAAYYDAVQKLRDPQILETAASIMASEGQHLVVLRQALGRPPVPNAFETGET